MRWPLLILIALLSFHSQAKVDPPNYDFSLDNLAKFYPDKKLTEIQKEYGEGEVIQKNGAFLTYKFYVAHIRYKFPVLVQTANGSTTDFYARLPQYFLHDVFHQSLINRIGKQDIYKKVGEQAVYIWKNQKGLKHVYSGSCTITCFPIFYSVSKVKHSYGADYRPLLEQMYESEKETNGKTPKPQ